MTKLPQALRAVAGAVLLATALTSCSDTAGPRQGGRGLGDQLDGKTLFRGLLLGEGPAADLLTQEVNAPRVRDLVTDPATLAQVLALQDRLIAAVDSMNPGFLAEFAAAMTSGDHIRVERMYEKAATITIRTLLTLDQVRRVKDALADREKLNAAVDQRLAALSQNDPAAREAVQHALSALATASSDGSGVRPLLQKVSQDYGGSGGGGCSYVAAVVAAVYYVAAVDVAVVSNAAVAISIAVTLAVTVPKTSTTSTQTSLDHERVVHAVATLLASTPHVQTARRL